jgi:hypothetical protein
MKRIMPLIVLLGLVAVLAAASAYAWSYPAALNTNAATNRLA